MPAETIMMSLPNASGDTGGGIAGHRHRRHAVATLTPEQQQGAGTGTGPRHPLPSIRLDARDPNPASATVASAAGAAAPAPAVQCHLGRNLLTRIHDTAVSRNLATLTLTLGDGGGGPRLTLRTNKGPGEHHMFLNGNKVKAEAGGFGHVELRDGDLLSLWGDRYPYRVSLSTTVDTGGTNATATAGGNGVGPGGGVSNHAGESGSSSSSSSRRAQPLPATISVPRPASPPPAEEKPTRKRRAGGGGGEHATPPSSPVRRQRSAAARDMVEEATCSVCMDVVVRATAVLPCGHTFCAACVEPPPNYTGGGATRYQFRGGRLLQCPNCRGDVAGVVPVRALDAVVLGMVKRGDFDRDDVEDYLRRSGTNLTEEEMENIMGVTAKGKVKRQKLSSPPDWTERETQNANEAFPSSEQLSPPGDGGGDADDDDDDEIEVVGVVMQQPQPSSGGQGTNMDDAICLD